jgi:3-polyprenyl-4-hydroxybenzoate decarboxylase
MRRLAIGISGATGIAYGTRLLELAGKAGVQSHLVVPPAASLLTACLAPAHQST